MSAKVKELRKSTNQLLTYEDYLALPEMMQRYEIIDGEMIMSPAPTSKHQLVVGSLYRSLHSLVRRWRLGVVLLSPLDIIIHRVPRLRTRQPDLIFVSRERQAIIHDQIEGGPDLVIEVLSPSDTRRVIERKLEDYRRIGVRECWMVSIEGETVEVLKLSARGVRRLGLYGPGDVVRSQVLPSLALPIKKIFA
jgi:Uma2 family endonuclease